MIFGILGKGGSGKSTVATLLVRDLERQNKNVLAIDADHNIDLAYNLGVQQLPKPLHAAFGDMREKVGDRDAHYSDLVADASVHSFSISPLDSVSEMYSVPLTPRVCLMAAGEQSEEVLRGDSCSHSLASPLKLYLPLLHLTDNDAVVVDEKASVDAVSTGIPTGFDVAVVVVHPAPHSIRVGRQILDLLEQYDVPSVVIANKVMTEEDVQHIARGVGRESIMTLPSTTVEEVHDFSRLYAFANEVSIPNISRLERSKKKFEQQRIGS